MKWDLFPFEFLVAWLRWLLGYVGWLVTLVAWLRWLLGYVSCISAWLRYLLGSMEFTRHIATSEVGINSKLQFLITSIEFCWIQNNIILCKIFWKVFLVKGPWNDLKFCMTFRSLDDGVKPRKLNNDFTYFERLSSAISADASDLSESSGKQKLFLKHLGSNLTRHFSWVFCSWKAWSKYLSPVLLRRLSSSACDAFLSWHFFPHPPE